MKRVRHKFSWHKGILTITLWKLHTVGKYTGCLCCLQIKTERRQVESWSWAGCAGYPCGPVAEEAFKVRLCTPWIKLSARPCAIPCFEPAPRDDIKRLGLCVLFTSAPKWHVSVMSLSVYLLLGWDSFCKGANTAEKRVPSPSVPASNWADPARPPRIEPHHKLPCLLSVQKLFKEYIEREVTKMQKERKMS